MIRVWSSIIVLLAKGQAKSLRSYIYRPKHIHTPILNFFLRHCAKTTTAQKPTMSDTVTRTVRVIKKVSSEDYQTGFYLPIFFFFKKSTGILTWKYPPTLQVSKILELWGL